MHVVFINSTKKWGGVKTWTLDMAGSLLKDEHKVSILARDPVFLDKAKQQYWDIFGNTVGGKTDNTQSKLLIRKVNFGFDFNPISIAFFFKFFKKTKPDLVIVNVAKDLRTAGMAAALLNIKIVQHVGAPFDFKNTLKNRLVHTLTKPHLVCCSEYTKQTLAADVPYLKNHNLTAIHPGTSIPKSEPSKCQKPYVLISAGQLVPVKAHDQLLLACAELKKQGLDFKLRILGTGSLQSKLKKLCTKLDLDDRTVFMGFCSNVGTELSQADIFILPSKHEPLGIALEEAMAYGLVPLARNKGGVPEIWPEQFKNFLLPDDNFTDSLVNTLAEILNYPPEKIMGIKHKTKAHASINFSQELQYNKFINWVLNL